MKKLCYLTLAILLLTSCDKIVRRVQLENGDILECKEAHNGKIKIYNGSLCILEGKYRIRTIDRKSGNIVYYQGYYDCGVINSYGSDIIPVGSGYDTYLVNGPEMIYYLVYDHDIDLWGMFDENGEMVVPFKYKWVSNNLDDTREDTTPFRCVIFCKPNKDIDIYSLDKKRIVKKYENASFWSGKITDKTAPDVIRQFYQIIDVKEVGHGVFDCYHCREVIPPKYKRIEIGHFIKVEGYDSIEEGAFDYYGHQLVAVRDNQAIFDDIDDTGYVEVSDYRDDYTREYTVQIPRFDEERFLQLGFNSNSSSYANDDSYYGSKINSYPIGYSSSTTTVSSSGSSQPKEVHHKEKCFKCNGSGRVIVYFSVPAFGNDYEEWCEECHSTHMHSEGHRHTDCDICNGTGYVDSVTYE